MDLPAPVSPVSTARPRQNSISSRSIRTMSRIDRRASMRDRFLMVWFGRTLLPGASLSREVLNRRLRCVGWAKLADANASGSVPTVQSPRSKWGWWARRKSAFAHPTGGARAASAEPQLLERLGDVGALVLARLETAGLHKIIGVLVPFTV